jgi:hemoglobin
MASTTTSASSLPRPFRDLDTRSEIHDLVVRFYREIVFDELLAPVFTDVAEVDWAVHIPKLIDFWCRVILGEAGYDGFVLGAHRAVHDEAPFRAELFDRWYALWVETVDESWRGPRAELAKDHAARIAATLARRLLGIEWEAPGAAQSANDRGRRQGLALTERDTGGETACWAHLVCPECGGVHE